MSTHPLAVIAHSERKIDVIVTFRTVSQSLHPYGNRRKVYRQPPQFLRIAGTCRKKFLAGIDHLVHNNARGVSGERRRREVRALIPGVMITGDGNSCVGGNRKPAMCVTAEPCNAEGTIGKLELAVRSLRLT